MGFLKEIFGALFQSIIAGIMDWIQQEQGEAAKWEAAARKQQLDSIKVGQEKEEEFRRNIKDAAEKTLSASGWNAGLLVLLMLTLTGCFRFYVSAETYRPVPPKIDRPQIAEDPELTEREKILMRYALQLEAAYNSVRVDTIEHNAKAGFPTPSE